MALRCLLIRHGHVAVTTLLLLFSQQTVASRDEEQEESQSLLWTGLIRCLLAVLLVVFGLHILLYSHLETYRLMKHYQEEGVPVSGNVLSCEASRIHRNKCQVSVLYMAPFHADSSTAGVQYKRYLRRIEMDHAMTRGTVVEMLLLSGQPKSGLVREVVHQHVTNHSWLRTVLLLVPGLGLVAVMTWLAIPNVQAMENPTLGWIVMVLALFVTIPTSRAICASRFQQEKEKRFNSAVSMKVKSQTTMVVGQDHDNDKSEPLLCSNGVPIVMEKDVI